MLVHLLPRPAFEVLGLKGARARHLISYWLCCSCGNAKMQITALVARKLPFPMLFARVIKPGAKPNRVCVVSEPPPEPVYRA